MPDNYEHLKSHFDRIAQKNREDHAAVREQRDDLLAALKVAEWPWTGANGASVQRCSCCGRDRIDGHNAVCRVGLAIARAEGR